MRASHIFPKMLSFGWASSLVLLVGGMVLSFLLFGYFYTYWLYADQDFILAYQGLLYNEGLPQEYFDHTGYLSYLLIGSWYRLLHGLGLLEYHALSVMPPASDPSAAATAWQSLVRSGRVLSLVTAVFFTCLFAALMRRLLGEWRTAIMAATAFAFAGSLSMHTRMIRTELLTGCLVATAFLLLLFAARDARTRWRPALAGLAALCATLALENKVQAILPILALPLLVLALSGALRERNSSWANARWAWPVTIVLMAIAVVLAIPAGTLVARGMTQVDSSLFQYHELGLGLAGRYQILFVLWFVGAMLAFAVWRRVPASEAVAALACATAGCGLGILALLIRANDQNIIALTHPLEHQFVFAVWKDPALGQESAVVSHALIGKILSGLGEVLRAHTFGLHKSRRPTLILEWFMVGVAIIAWRRGDRRIALEIATVLGTVIALETVFTLRGMKIEYFIFTEPFTIVAAAIVFVRFKDLWRRALPPGVLTAIFAVLILWANVEPARKMFNRRGPSLAVTPEEVCGWAPSYLKRVDQLPFCPTPARKP